MSGTIEVSRHARATFMGAAATTTLLVLAGVVVLFLSVSLYGRIAALSWERTPYPPGRLIDAAGTRLYVRVKGDDTPVVVIEPALGSPAAEWWHIQEELARTTTVVTYDRAGYGWSRPGTRPRTGRQVVEELHTMLHNAALPGPYILVGHSQGGLYMQLFGRLYPDEVAGAVFLDPLSSDNRRFKAELKPEVYKNSQIDTLPTINSVATLQRLGLMRVLRGVIEPKMLGYHQSLPAPTREVIWQHYAMPKARSAIMDEYAQNATPANTSDVRSAGTFPDVPVKILYHSPRRMVRELMAQGRLQRDDADEVEMIWEQLVRGYLRLSPHGEWIVAQESGHYIHLDEPDVVLNEINELVEAVRSSGTRHSES
ncbi:MAG: alpha/beta hydrolase [Chloroflexota bacterium]